MAKKPTKAKAETAAPVVIDRTPAGYGPSDEKEPTRVLGPEWDIFK